MTDKELKRLKRRDLLKMLLDTERENRYLSEQMENCREELQRYKKIIDGEIDAAMHALMTSWG